MKHYKVGIIDGKIDLQHSVAKYCNFIGLTKTEILQSQKLKRDYAKWLVSKLLNLKLISIKKDFDALDNKNKSYKINDSGLLSKNFHHLINSPITIYDASQGRLRTNWKALEVIYRRLKQSYQKYGDYDTAGKFYFQEMECKRKQLGFLSYWFWNIFYRGFCGYGEKPFNTVFVSVFMVILFATFYFYNGIKILEMDTEINYAFSPFSLSSYNFSWIEDFLWCLYMSVTAFTTMGYGDVQPIDWSRLIAAIEAGIGIFMTALFIFVFTRKMLR